MKYRLLSDRFDRKAGIIVYPCKKHDYGLAREDTEVTTDPEGGYPYFTVPVCDLKSLE